MSWAGEVAEDGDTANLKGKMQRSVHESSTTCANSIFLELGAMVGDVGGRAEVLDDRKRQVLSHISVRLELKISLRILCQPRPSAKARASSRHF